LHKIREHGKNELWAGKTYKKLVKKQAKIISEQAETIKKLEALVAELRETIVRLQKDSRNSSKPPSSKVW
jgi:methionine synthase II (cobalamin-independent)